MKRTLFALTCLVVASVAIAEDDFRATVNDIVTPKVVSVAITSGKTPPSGTLLIAKRKGAEVAKLKLRTPSGICNVVSGSVKKGDLVTLAAVHPAATVANSDTEKPPTDAAEAFATYSKKDAVNDPGLSALLEAEGLLLTANYVASLKGGNLNDELKKKVAESQQSLKRIAIAKAVMALETPRQRVVAELIASGNTVLANTVSENVDKKIDPPAPILPDQAKDFPLNAFGEASVITKDLSSWKTPQYWGEEPIDPNFSGWTMGDNSMLVSENSDALVRSDLLLGDAEVSGKLRIDSGTSLFIILRSEVVVKFIHESASCGVALKAGYNNLRFISNKGSCDLLERNRWYEFRISMVGEAVQVFLDGKRVLECGVSMAGETQVKLPERGYIGLGSYYGNGRFKDVRVRALSSTGMASIPVFRKTRVYKKVGEAVDLLDGKQDYASIYGTKVQSHRRIHHSVANGMVTFTGSPFAQFTTKDLARDNYRVSGKLRIAEEGNIWLRMNEKLLFGISAMAAGADREEGAHAFYVKYRLGNYLSYDHGFAGVPLKPNDWYEWELDYTHPSAILKINGRQVALARCPEDETPEPGWNHFGISAYNVKAEFTNLRFQPLSFQNPDLPDDAELLSTYSKAETILKSFEKAVTGAGSGKASAQSVLQGTRPPVIADSDDFKTVSVTFRQANNWPVYLRLLEANYQRFAESSKERKAAESVWRLARQKFDIAQETLEAGDLGLDNTIVLDKPSAAVAAAREKGLWYYLAGAKKLQLLDPLERTILQSLKWPHATSRIVDRGTYLLAFSEENKTIWKLDPESGKELAEVTVPNGKILDWAGATESLSFISVDENAVNEQIFMKYVIYALNEETMGLYNSGGFGQMLAADPFGRYLYSGITIQAGGTMKQLDPSPLRPVPQGRTLDHLVCFSISGQDLSLVSDRPAPGLLGKSLAVVPSGRYVCYVAERGFKRNSDNALTGDKVAAFRAAQVSRALNSFDCGGRPTLMAFNPLKSVTYIYNGSQIRSFHTNTFEMLSTYSLPAASVTGSGTALSVDASGRFLYLAYSGKPGGIAIFDALEKGGGEEFRSPQSMFAEAESLIDEKKTEAATKILSSLADTMLFSEFGEKVAGLLLELERNPAGDSTWTPETALDRATINATPPPSTVSTPAAPKNDVRRPSIDPDHKEDIDNLKSFSDLTTRFPKSWAYSCLSALKNHPENLEVLLLMAESDLEAGKADSGAIHAESLLKQAANQGYYAVKAYSLLARASVEPLHKLHFLKHAVELDPRNPFLHKRLGDAYKRAGFKDHSTYHLRMSLHLFPSQRSLRESLTAAGFSVSKPSDVEREIDDLYKALAPSAVMIRHNAGVGTGFFITRDGLLLTNQHVIGDTVSTWTVHMTDAAGTKHKLPARVVASDARLDIAILSVDLGAIAIEPMLLASPELAKTGMRTIAIGNPGMGSEILARTVTEGIISNVSQRVGGQYYIQTSAAVNPGNSGGPLLSRHGVVIGMVTLKASLDNVGFAIPTDRLFKFLEDNLN